MRTHRQNCLLSVAGFTAWTMVLAAGPRAASAETAALVNLTAGDAQALCSICEKSGMTAKPASLNAGLPGDVRLIVLQARENLSAAEAERLGKAVQNGAALLVTLGPEAGKDAFTVSFMLPTMAWSWHREEEGPFSATNFDPEIFGPSPGAPQGLSVPYLHEIRPFHATERGQARYDDLNREELFTAGKNGAGKFLPAGSNEWTRPLIDRDWKVRATLSGIQNFPLLITGRYGRGHVAVLACGPEVLDQKPGGQAFAADMMKWLLESPSTATQSDESIPQPKVTVDQPSRSLKVELSNPSSHPLSVTVLGRVMTWEPAMIGDVAKPATIPAGGSTVVELPLPPLTDTSYAAVADRDVYEVRLGVLSGDGEKLIAPEMRVQADLRPPLLAKLDADDIRKYQWPFAPGEEMAPKNRMGARLDEYVYKPGETVHAQLTLDNGAHNLARIAKAADLTTPDNPTVSALNDGWAASGREVDSSLKAYGAWQGKSGADNVVTLTFPQPVLVNAVVLVGAPDDYKKSDQKNPSAVIVAADGKQIAREMSLADRFLAEAGRVRISFDPVRATTLQLTLPWKDDGQREAPELGDVEVWGTTAENFPAAAAPDVSLALRDLLTDKLTPIGSKQIQLAPGGHETPSFDLPTPKTDGKADFYRIEATVGDQHLECPIVTIDPHVILPSIASLRGGDKGVAEGFIVTRGFRNVFDVGTGTAEIPPHAWETPDDLVWGYSRGLKENSKESPYLASKMYVTENDMRHYSTQWRHFYDGEPFYDVATPALLHSYEKKPGWADSTVEIMGHSDRWDAAPPVFQEFSWPEYIAFDQWLRTKHLGKLTGKTKTELGKEVEEKYRGPWYAYQLEQYSHSVGELNEAFAAAGKQLLITAQGCPLVPPAFAKAICAVIRGTSDDSTWGMVRDDIIATTGKQMGAVAFNPYLKMSTIAQWQYNSSTLNNPQWHNPAGTTEPSRRHLFDRAFRGVIRLDGSYTSIHSYGFNSNAGDPMTLTDVDYTQWKRVRDLHALLQPDAALGAGLVIANSYLNDPIQTRFGAEPLAAVESQAISRDLGILERAGVSVPFSANAMSLKDWHGSSPLIVLNLQKFTPAEISILKSTLARGVKVAAFFEGDDTLPADAAALFGVDPHGKPASGKSIGQIDGRSIVSNGTALFVPLDGEKMQQQQLDAMAPLLIEQLAIPVKFDTGSTGYGFISNGRTFIVVEDWQEQPRVLHLSIHAGSAPAAVAVNINDSTRLAVHKEQGNWIIDVPTRPGDGNLICVQETTLEEAQK